MLLAKIQVFFPTGACLNECRVAWYTAQIKLKFTKSEAWLNTEYLQSFDSSKFGLLFYSYLMSRCN